MMIFRNIFKYYKKRIQASEDGLSVVEVMLAITIAGMIAGAITSFLFMHIKSFELSKDLIDIQFESQVSMNQLSRVVMESEGILYLQDDLDASGLNNTGALINPKAIAFAKDSDMITLFQYDSISKALFFIIIDTTSDPNPYNLDMSAKSWDIFAEHVDTWSVGSGVSNASFLNTDNISISLSFKDDDIELSLNNLFKMRNKRP